MISIRKSEDRGSGDHGWLHSRHSFSFAGYFDPRHMGWGNLRVINEDHVAPGKGFETHAHRDMEIVTYVLAGVLAHKDTLGNVKTIPAGDVQRMTAGMGVQHSEFNHSSTEEVDFLQIWLLPSQRNLPPGHEQKTFSAIGKRGRLQLAASPDAAEGSLRIGADARIFAGLFTGDENAELRIPHGRKSYVHVVRGSLQVNGRLLLPGDAALLQDEALIRLDGGMDAEVLVFDLRGD